MLTLSGLATLISLAHSSVVLSQQFSPVAESFTVRVDAPGDGDGSGVIIARDGNTYYVLTAWHVVDNPGTYFVRTRDSRTYEVNFADIERLSDYDLAVLRFNSFHDYQLASINNERLVSNQPISVSGWRNPTRAITKITYQFISGRLTGYSIPPEEGGYSLTLSTGGVFRGMSGGPVVDEDYKVVGIIGQVDSVIEGLTGLSLGIPISAFLDSHYGQYIQTSQISGPTPGDFDITPTPLPRIPIPSEVYVPEQRELPRIE